MKLSVIIPCKNEAGTVEHLLDSLAAQSQPPDEVVVVDSHSSDSTATIAKSYSSKLSMKVITARQVGVTHARNEGAAAASGELFLFIDADVKLPRNFIAKMQQNIARRRLEVGSVAQHMQASSLGLRVGSRFMNGYVRTMSLTPWPIFFSCFFVTKEVHKRINGFDPDLWIMEDYDYAYRARQAGARFGMVKGTYFIASPRRFEEGEGHSISRAIYAEVYRYTHGMRIIKPLFRYDMSGERRKNKDNN